MKDIRVQHRLALVDEADKTLHPPGAGKVIFLAAAFILEANAHAIVQKTEFTQTLAQNFIVKITVLLEDFGIGQEMHLGTTLLGLTNDLHGRHVHAVKILGQAVLHKTLAELQQVHLAITAHSQAQHF